MKASALRIVLWVLCCGAAINNAPTNATGQGMIGVAPVYDSSGDDWGPTFAQYLTLNAFEQLQTSGAMPTLLNPGGVYSLRLATILGLIRTFGGTPRRGGLALK